MVVRAVLDEDAGRDRARPVAQPGRTRRGCHAQGAAHADHRAARDADEPAAAAQHGALRRSRRDHPAGDAGVLPDAADTGRSRGLHDRQDPQPARLPARAVPADGGVERRQDPGPHRDDVRRDCAALRPAQSRPQRRPRSAVADAGHRGAAARPGRQRPRSLHRHRRSRGRSGAACGRACRWSASTSPARCSGWRTTSCARCSSTRAIRLVRGDGTRIPLATGCCDAATIGFGIRNVVDPAAALAEIARVLRPGGRLAILEFGQPRIPGMRTLYAWYFRYLLPLVGRLISKHQSAYSYLPASVGTFPSAAEFSRDDRCHRIFTGPRRPSDLRHRLPVRRRTPLSRIPSGSGSRTPPGRSGGTLI